MAGKEAATPPLRRSARVNVRVPVRVSGTLPDKKPFVEDTHIVTVSKYGAKMKSEQTLEVGMQIKVKPHQRKESGLFRVVWVGRAGTVREGEVGIEYVHVSNLLGIGFPE